MDARAGAPLAHHLRRAFRIPNGKGAGAMTGVRVSRHGCTIKAEGDVRHRRVDLVRMLDLLQQHEVVRPQTFSHP